MDANLLLESLAAMSSSAEEELVWHAFCVGRGAIVDEEMVKQVPRMGSSRAMLGGHGGDACFAYGEGGETFVEGSQSFQQGHQDESKG